MGKVIAASLMVLLVISAFMATSTSGAEAETTVEAATNATGSFGAFAGGLEASDESEEVIDGIDRDKPEMQNMTSLI